jgi:hypothetical protein
MAKGPVFLERQSYRRRRVMDAIKMLPFVGLVIWMVPVLWPQPDQTGAGIETGVALRYLFGGWIAMVCVGCVLWLRAGRQAGPSVEQQP